MYHHQHHVLMKPDTFQNVRIPYTVQQNVGLVSFYQIAFINANLLRGIICKVIRKSQKFSIPTKILWEQRGLLK